MKSIDLYSINHRLFLPNYFLLDCQEFCGTQDFDDS
eukprot:SAG11_NODE_41812_length_189_cov_25.355556_1_plen_35_part_01